MTIRIGNVTFDCDDVLKVGGFWSAAQFVRGAGDKSA